MNKKMWNTDNQPLTKLKLTYRQLLRCLQWALGRLIWHLQGLSPLCLRVLPDGVDRREPVEAAVEAAVEDAVEDVVGAAIKVHILLVSMWV